MAAIASAFEVSDLMPRADVGDCCRALMRRRIESALAKSVLHSHGVLSLHLGAPFFHTERVVNLLRTLRAVFPHVLAHTATVPLYGAEWAFACASGATDFDQHRNRTLRSTIATLRLADLQSFADFRGYCRLPFGQKTSP